MCQTGSLRSCTRIAIGNIKFMQLAVRQGSHIGRRPLGAAGPAPVKQMCDQPEALTEISATAGADSAVNVTLYQQSVPVLGPRVGFKRTL